MRLHNGTEERGFDYRVKKVRIYESSIISKSLNIKGLDNQVQISV
jgi:hypothetical protein